MNGTEIHRKVLNFLDGDVGGEKDRISTGMKYYKMNTGSSLLSSLILTEKIHGVLLFQMRHS